MSKQPVYTCACLNITIYLSDTYNEETHLQQRDKDCITIQDKEGWKCHLGSQGLKIAFDNLITTNTVDNWKTVGCFNCAMRHVYSVKLGDSLANYNVVVIHKQALFGSAVEQLKLDEHYSPAFGIIVKETERAVPIDQSSEDAELRSGRIKLTQLSEHSTDRIKQESEIRLERMREEEEARVKLEMSRVNTDYTCLWERMLEAAVARHTHVWKDKQVKDTVRESGIHVRFANDIEQTASEHDDNVQEESDQDEQQAERGEESQESSDMEEEDVFDMDESKRPSRKYILEKIPGYNRTEEATEPSTSSALYSMATSVPIDIMKPSMLSLSRLHADTRNFGHSLDTSQPQPPLRKLEDDDDD